MKRTLRVAALQLAAHDRAAFERGEVRVAAAADDAARETDVLVLPEGTLPAYVLGDDGIDERAVEREIDALRSVAAARGCAIVAGVALRRDGELYNAAIVIDTDGQVAGRAEKLILWHFDRKWFRAGSSIAPIRTAVGSLGVMICADGRMPGIASVLADRGAELLVMPTAWVTSGRNPAVLENAQADLLARVRAFENGLPFIAANKCGTERGIVAYCGKSQIIDGDGSIVAMAPQDEPATIRATVSLRTPRRAEPAPPPPLQAIPAGSIRLAFSNDEAPADLSTVLEILDADEWMGPASREVLDARWIYDPRVLPRYRHAGHRRIGIRSDSGDVWLEPIARTRALELRMYVVVFDLARDRAYVVDPDGTIVAGTFAGLRIASSPLDYARTENTLVAPGTDIAAGLEAVAHLHESARS